MDVLTPDPARTEPAPRADRVLELGYVAKVNAALEQDRTELAHELSAELAEHRARCA